MSAPKALLDGGFIGVFIATFTGWLPPILALLGIIWYCVQLWESQTGVHIRKWAGTKLARRAKIDQKKLDAQPQSPSEAAPEPAMPASQSDVPRPHP